MLAVILTLHVIVSLFLVVLVLLQAGQGAELGAAFGGLGQSNEGGRPPATILTKMTTVLATLFMLSSLVLAFWYHRAPTSVAQPATATQLEEAQPAENQPSESQSQEAKPQGTVPASGSATPAAEPPAGQTEPATKP